MGLTAKTVLELMPHVYGELKAKGIEASDAALYALLRRIEEIARNEQENEY